MSHFFHLTKRFLFFRALITAETLPVIFPIRKKDELKSRGGGGGSVLVEKRRKGGQPSQLIIAAFSGGKRAIESRIIERRPASR